MSKNTYDLLEKKLSYNTLIDIIRDSPLKKKKVDTDSDSDECITNKSKDIKTLMGFTFIKSKIDEL